MMHLSRQVKILSLTLRILLLTGRVSQPELLRAARIAAAEVRAREGGAPFARPQSVPAPVVAVWPGGESPTGGDGQWPG